MKTAYVLPSGHVVNIRTQDVQGQAWLTITYEDFDRIMEAVGAVREPDDESVGEEGI